MWRNSKENARNIEVTAHDEFVIMNGHLEQFRTELQESWTRSPLTNGMRWVYVPLRHDFRCFWRSATCASCQPICTKNTRTRPPRINKYSLLSILCLIHMGMCKKRLCDRSMNETFLAGSWRPCTVSAAHAPSFRMCLSTRHTSPAARWERVCGFFCKFPHKMALLKCLCAFFLVNFRTKCGSRKE